MFVLTDEVRTARKFYDCDACEMWRNKLHEAYWAEYAEHMEAEQ